MATIRVAHSHECLGGSAITGAVRRVPRTARLQSRKKFERTRLS